MKLHFSQQTQLIQRSIEYKTDRTDKTLELRG